LRLAFGPTSPPFSHEAAGPFTRMLPATHQQTPLSATRHAAGRKKRAPLPQIRRKSDMPNIARISQTASHARRARATQDHIGDAIIHAKVAARTLLEKLMFLEANGVHLPDHANSAVIGDLIPEIDRLLALFQQTRS
ncbi:MAG: hypothetical protein P8Y36_09875, partial [Alphaproteobacteria bacterium]